MRGKFLNFLYLIWKAPRSPKLRRHVTFEQYCARSFSKISDLFRTNLHHRFTVILTGAWYRQVAIVRRAYSSVLTSTAYIHTYVTVTPSNLKTIIALELILMMMYSHTLSCYIQPVLLYSAVVIAHLTRRKSARCILCSLYHSLYITILSTERLNYQSVDYHKTGL